MIKIYDKEDCCGCGACAIRCPHHCITLSEDPQGFLYPKVNLDKCVDCHLCERVCPCLNVDERRGNTECFSAVNPDDKVRLTSSSGGIFSMLSQAVLALGGVVFGARFDEEWNVLHDEAQTVVELVRFRGSKYVQSVTGDCYAKAQEYLKQGREVLFSGTPCQIAGLKQFLGDDDDKLLTVEVACHGVPSPKVWREYLRYISDGQPLARVDFRDKSTGWRDYSVVIGNKSRRHDYDEYMGCFLGNYSLRPSCFNCRFKQGSSGADITLADFWGMAATNGHLDDNKGTSLMVVFNDKAMRSLEQCGVNLIHQDFDKAIKSNPSLVKSATRPADCDEFWNLFCSGKTKIAIKWFGHRHRPGLNVQFKRIIRKLLHR